MRDWSTCDMMIDHDWGSTALWVRVPGEGWANAPYAWLGLPDALVERMTYWCHWLDSPRPEIAQPTIDWDAGHSYGLGLAIDLKRNVGDRHRVFYGVGDEIHLVEPATSMQSYPTVCRKT